MATKQSKKVQRDTITTHARNISLYDFEGSITDVFNKLNSLVQQYGAAPDAVFLEVDNEPYSDRQYFLLSVKRLETDEEYEARCASEKARLDALEKKNENEERAEYERLKKKFG